VENSGSVAAILAVLVDLLCPLNVFDEDVRLCSLPPCLPLENILTGKCTCVGFEFDVLCTIVCTIEYGNAIYQRLPISSCKVDYSCSEREDLSFVKVRDCLLRVCYVPC
jgi:hypothetical protein